VLLAVFSNATLGQSVTLAQVFWHRSATESVQKMFVVADAALAIAADFSDFGSQISGLRRRLKQSGAAIHDSYPSYAKDFRRRMGIDNLQAMELFHQTVSMKSVGNLTEFVRAHMLEPFDADERIGNLIDHFGDLMRAHESVIKAKRQVEQLAPLVTDLDDYDAIVAKRDEADAVRSALSRYVASRKIHLFDARIAATQAAMVLHATEAARLVANEEALRGEENELRDAINRNGGDRLRTLEQDRDRAADERNTRKAHREDYERVCASVGQQTVADAPALLAQVAAAAAEVERIEDRKAELSNSQTDRQVERRDLGAELAEVEQELHSLAERDSNIEARMVSLRESMAQACGLSTTDLPFVGELVRVKDDAWRGAAERLLRGFGLSMLVPDAHYRAISEWVDGNNLRGRLVYYRVREVPTAPTVSDDRSLVWKLDVKQESPFAPWVEASLAKRFNVVCAATAEEFRHADDALTMHGQVKRGRDRHEKDDRSAVDDRSRWVLGWDNADKRRHLAGRRDFLRAGLDALDTALRTAAADLRRLDALRDDLRELQRFTDFAALDWQSSARDIERMDQEIAALRESSNVLRELNAQLDRVRGELERTRAETLRVQDLASRSQARLEDDGRARQRLLDQHPGLLDPEPADGGHPGAEAMGRHLADALPDGEEPPEPEGWDDVQVRKIDLLNRQITLFDDRARRRAGAVTKRMGEFRTEWPIDSQELDVSVEGGHEYRQLLGQLRSDDLPRFEHNFKDMLNQNAIREVASLHTTLRAEQQKIKRRVEIINESLRDIDYQPHTYIRLESEPSADADIRTFVYDLKACTENTLASGTEDDSYSEAKFLQVKEIVSRLSGRDGHAEEDKRWRAKVTDVRTWFTFAASERVSADDTEHEHYSDSGGKSGGQKEKLAYTILAASLAYQFGLVSGGMQARTFRFVVIDEAFGRGSDESARFGLELFRRLGLQLLVVTPLQKIHVIEPFVARVGFVHNDGGQTSRLATLTIDEFREGARSSREARAATR
jgi:uncharacterized protein YPO0396